MKANDDGLKANDDDIKAIIDDVKNITWLIVDSLVNSKASVVKTVFATLII